MKCGNFSDMTWSIAGYGTVHKCERQIRTISEIIMKHLWDKGQMWPLFATTAAQKH